MAPLLSPPIAPDENQLDGSQLPDSYFFTHDATVRRAPSVSGLGLRERQKARRLTREAAYLGYRHAAELHYTQGAERWQGIHDHLKAYRGEYPRWADCSAFATWCLWNGLDHFGVHDIVNGENWLAGFTGTMLNNGRSVGNGWFKVGDCVIYGNGGTGKHVAVVVEPERRTSRTSQVISHGSEAGPYLLNWNYRSDIMDVRRYI